MSGRERADRLRAGAGFPIGRPVSPRRILRFLVLLALVVAPFGRIGIAQAMAMPHQMPSAMASHCAGQPMPDRDKDERVAVDCMIACAVMAPPSAPLFAPPPAAESVPAAVPVFFLSGIQPEADPPPPRFS